MVVLLALAAGTARAAGVQPATHTHHIARFKLGDGAARRHDAADNLVARHAGVDGVVPVVFDLVHIRCSTARRCAPRRSGVGCAQWSSA